MEPTYLDLDKAVSRPNVDEVAKRRAVWESAEELVAPIVLVHGLEAYNTGTNIFAQSTKMTPVDQHVEVIIRVADWLLDS